MPTDTMTPDASDLTARALDNLVTALVGALPSPLVGANVRDPAAVSRYLARDFRAELRRAEEAIADALPALKPATFREKCNGDHALRAEIERFRDGRWSMVDVSELRLGDEEHGHAVEGEAWTILRGSSRFEVREVPRYEAYSDGPDTDWYVHDNEHDTNADAGDAKDALSIPHDVTEYTEEQARAIVEWLATNAPGRDPEPCYLVWDTDNDERMSEGSPDYFPEYDPADESSATEAAAAANVEDYRTNAAGWPFAHNYAAAIDERDADDFHAAGFVVATHEPSGQVYAGIDGGGYSFTDAHWAPLYLRFHLTRPTFGPGCIYVPTDDGLRRVVRE